MSPALKAGLIFGLRRAVVPFVLAALCFIASLWAIDDMFSLLRVIGWVLIIVGLVLVASNVLRARATDEPLNYRHGGYEDKDSAR